MSEPIYYRLSFIVKSNKEDIIGRYSNIESATTDLDTFRKQNPMFRYELSGYEQPIELKIGCSVRYKIIRHPTNRSITAFTTSREAVDYLSQQLYDSDLLFDAHIKRGPYLSDKQDTFSLEIAGHVVDFVSMADLERVRQALPKK